MKKRILAAGLALVASAVVSLAQGLPALGDAAADKPPQVRSLQGQVVDTSNAPVPESIVYLKNTKTLTVKTYIADNKGMYRFNALSPNVDYEVYAEHNGQRSDTKTLSSFDTRQSATINLKIK